MADTPKRVDLPDGQWAELRDPAQAPERLRRPVASAYQKVRPEILQGLEAANDQYEAAKDSGDQEALKLAELARARAAAAMSPGEIDALSDANDHGIVALVAVWSYPQPVSIEAALDLPGRAYDALRTAVAPLIGKMWLDARADPNQPAPGGGSNGSAASSPAAPAIVSPSTGGPTGS